MAASPKVVERKSARDTWQKLEAHHSKIRGLHLRQLFAKIPGALGAFVSKRRASFSTIRRTGSRTKPSNCFCSSQRRRIFARANTSIR